MLAPPTSKTMDEAALGALVTLERDLAHYQSPPPAGRPGFAALHGRRPVLISAPHGTRHWRADHWKMEEDYTTAMAHWLAAQTGAFALYATHALRPDPHADSDAGPYKAALTDLLAVHDIQFVLDLHGVSGGRGFGLALGTINGESCPDHETQVVACLHAGGFSTNYDTPSLDRLALNHPRYTGGVNRRTVTRFACRICGVPAAQLEISAWLRVVKRLEGATVYDKTPRFRGDPPRILRLLSALTAFIETIS